MFFRPYTMEKFPVVTLPMTGQLVYPGAHVVLSGIAVAIPSDVLSCKVMKVLKLKYNGWKHVLGSNTGHVFGVYQDRSKTFLQWLGTNEDRQTLQQCLVLIRMKCENDTQDGAFEPCVALRVGWTPGFKVPVKESILSLQANFGFAIIGVCVGILSLVYVLIYIKALKNKLKEWELLTSCGKTTRGKELNVEEGVQILLPPKSGNHLGPSLPDHQVSYRENFPSGRQALESVIVSQGLTLQQCQGTEKTSSLPILRSGLIESHLSLSSPGSAEKCFARNQEMMNSVKQRLQGYKPTLQMIPEDDYLIPFPRQNNEQLNISGRFQRQRKGHEIMLRPKGIVERYHDDILGALSLEKELHLPQPPPGCNKFNNNHLETQNGEYLHTSVHTPSDSTQQSRKELHSILPTNSGCVENISKLNMCRFDLLEKFGKLLGAKNSQDIRGRESVMSDLDVKSRYDIKSTKNVEDEVTTFVTKQAGPTECSSTCTNSGLFKQLFPQRLSSKEYPAESEVNFEVLKANSDFHMVKNSELEKDITKSEMTDEKLVTAMELRQDESLNTSTASRGGNSVVCSLYIEGSEDSLPPSNKFDDVRSNFLKNGEMNNESLPAFNVKLPSKQSLTESEDMDANKARLRSLSRMDLVYERKGDLLLSKLNDRDLETSCSFQRFIIKHRIKHLNENVCSTSNKHTKRTKESALNSDHPSIQDYIEISEREVKTLSETRLPGISCDFLKRSRRYRTISTLSQLIQNFRFSIQKLNKQFKLKHERKVYIGPLVSENWTLKREDGSRQAKKGQSTNTKHISSFNSLGRRAKTTDDDKISTFFYPARNVNTQYCALQSSSPFIHCAEVGVMSYETKHITLKDNLKDKNKDPRLFTTDNFMTEPTEENSEELPEVSGFFTTDKLMTEPPEENTEEPLEVSDFFTTDKFMTEPPEVSSFFTTDNFITEPLEENTEESTEVSGFFTTDNFMAELPKENSEEPPEVSSFFTTDNFITEPPEGNTEEPPEVSSFFSTDKFMTEPPEENTEEPPEVSGFYTTENFVTVLQENSEKSTEVSSFFSTDKFITEPPEGNTEELPEVSSFFTTDNFITEPPEGNTEEPPEVSSFFSTDKFMTEPLEENTEESTEVSGFFTTVNFMTVLQENSEEPTEVSNYFTTNNFMTEPSEENNEELTEASYLYDNFNTSIVHSSDSINNSKFKNSSEQSDLSRHNAAVSEGPVEMDRSDTFYVSLGSSSPHSDCSLTKLSTFTDYSLNTN
ncbi:uncharacterized protein LOC143225401 [Tachypleus tridentatus]|uniref:uncharacterized protein LOC143225401 n=1 Tax=Tachypleus tridentatus TaxID=6853 RepID=UPI003FCF20DC